MSKIKRLLFFCNGCDDKWSLDGDVCYDEINCEICGKSTEGCCSYSAEIELFDLLLKIMRKMGD